MKAFFLIVASLLVCASAMAQAGPAQTKELQVSGQTPPVLLDGVACDAGAAALTWTSSAGETAGWGVGIFQLDLTDADGSETGLTITPSVRMEGSSAWAPVPPCDSVTDGTCALTGGGDITCTQANSCLSGNNPSVAFRLDFLGFSNIKIVVACTAGATADEVTLRGKVSAQ
jgi:hypothetical protein